MTVSIRSRRHAGGSARWLASLHAPRTRYGTLTAFIIATFLLGGGARSDITSLMILRPLSFIALGYALIFVDRRRLASLGAPFYLLLALGLLIGLQLIPLAPGLWRSLPGRELAASMTDAAGLEGVWRPVALSPSRALNALLSLGVPLAGFAMFAMQEKPPTVRLVWLLAVIGLANAVVGLLQVIGPPYGPLYLYRVTNNGVAVGLFANRNHNAIFLACLIPLLGYLALQSHRSRRGKGNMIVAGGALAATLFFIPLILVSGSRAGTVLGFVAVLLTGTYLWIYQRLGRGAARSGDAVVRFAGLAFVIAVAAMALITYALSRSLAFERFLKDSTEGGLRAQALPEIWKLAHTYFPVGSGFGSFYLIYQAAEPADLLQERYLNQAHNDPLQLLIEGGLPAAIIGLALIAWFLVVGWKAAKRFGQDAVGGKSPAISLFAWSSLAIFFAGSVLDYPLRTPSIMLTAALLCALIQTGLGLTAEPANRELR